MKVVLASLRGVLYKVREATRGELSKAYEIDDDITAEEFLVRNCVLEPRLDMNTTIAGTISSLASLVVDLSSAGNESVAALEDKTSKWLMTPAGKLDALIMGVLHKTPSEVESMYTEEWYKAVAASQLIATTLYGLNLQAYMQFGEQKPLRPPTRPPGQNLPPVAR